MKIQKKQEIEFFGTKTGNANSIALGYATETKNFGEVAVGVMNKSTAAKDPNSSKGVCADPDATLFSVGCGGSGERKNALEVKGDGSVIIPGENGDINVADKIKQVLDTDASIELVKSTDSDLQYTLMVNNESRGSINIPKDQFLKNVTYDTEAKQLVFTFVTLDEEEHVERISINDLKEVYTAGNGINIDNNVISADFSSVEAAISDEKTQRETADDEIKSTLNSKADLNNAITYRSYNISGLFDNDGNKQESYGYHCVDIGFNNAKHNSDTTVCIGSENTELERGSYSVCMGTSNTFNYGSVCVGNNINSGYSDSVYIGSRIKTVGINSSSNNTIIGSYEGSDTVDTPVGFISIGYYPRTDTDGKVLYQIGAHKKNSNSYYNLEETLTSDYDHKKYIYGIGGYDGTDPITTNAKSLQEVLTGKADASAIPTKVSQLTNDSGYLTEHQSLDNCVKIGDDNTPTQLFKGQGIATVNARQLILGSPSGGVDIQPNSINVNSPSFTFKATPTEGLGFIANTVNKGVTLTPQGGIISIGFDAKDANVEIGGSLVGQNTAGAVYNVDGSFVNLNPLYAFKTKFENSIVLNSALNNITAATTAEEVVTKFNALLADLKAKGFMTADITA